MCACACVCALARSRTYVRARTCLCVCVIAGICAPCVCLPLYRWSVCLSVLRLYTCSVLFVYFRHLISIYTPLIVIQLAIKLGLAATNCISPSVNVSGFKMHSRSALYFAQGQFSRSRSRPLSSVGTVISMAIITSSRCCLFQAREQIVFAAPTRSWLHKPDQVLVMTRSYSNSHRIILPEKTDCFCSDSSR